MLSITKLRVTDMKDAIDITNKMISFVIFLLATYFILQVPHGTDPASLAVLALLILACAYIAYLINARSSKARKNINEGWRKFANEHGFTLRENAKFYRLSDIEIAEGICDGQTIKFWNEDRNFGILGSGDSPSGSYRIWTIAETKIGKGKEFTVEKKDAYQDTRRVVVDSEQRNAIVIADLERILGDNDKEMECLARHETFRKIACANGALRIECVGHGDRDMLENMLGALVSTAKRLQKKK